MNFWVAKEQGEENGVGIVRIRRVFFHTYEKSGICTSREEK
jgi:hypothetical protein